MTAFELGELFAEHARRGRLYSEFLRVSALSMGLYILAANGTDPQKPHAEDEVYYVLSGQGKVRVGEEDREVQSGTVVFVPAKMPHHFHGVSEDLKLLVFFAPAEETAAK